MVEACLDTGRTHIIVLFSIKQTAHVCDGAPGVLKKTNYVLQILIDGTAVVRVLNKNNIERLNVCVCFLPIHSGHQVRWTYQVPAEVTQDFSSTFIVRCVP